MKNLAKAILILILSIGLNQSYSQEWSWGLKATGDNQSDYRPSSEIHVDYYGNVVIAGYYQQNFGLGSFSLFTEDNYYSDIFLSRINKDGEVKWLKHIEAGESYGDDIGVTVDDDSNIYLTGSKEGRIFVTKYDSLGTLVWNQDFNQEYYGYGRAIGIDQFDNVYVAGGRGYDFFMAKLDYKGNTVWKKDIWVNSSNGCNVTDIAVDAFGNIYFIGVFGIDTLPLDDIVLEHDGGWGDDTFFGKMDTNGNFIWVKSSSGRTNSNPQIALTSDNNLFLSGALYTGITFDNISIDGICCQEPKPYIAKYTTEGNVLWAKAGFSSYSEKGVTHDIKVDYNGFLYLTGTYFTCYGTFCTENDFYLERYNNAGEHLWRKEVKMPSFDFSKAIDIDNNGYLYNIGFNNSATFIDENQYSNIRTIGVGKLNTGSSTNKRTPRPYSKRFVQVCDNNTISLEAKGENIKWYSDPLKSNLMWTGNLYAPTLTSTDTLYVTQTFDEIESWPKEIILYISDIPDDFLTSQNDTIKAPYGKNFKYQWLYNGDSIVNSTRNFELFDAIHNCNLFSVIISDFSCSKTLHQEITSIVPATPVVNITQPICTTATGTIMVTVQNSGETYSFDNGVTYQLDNSKQGLATGAYQIIIKSRGSCNNSEATSAVVNAQPAIPAKPTIEVNESNPGIPLLTSSVADGNQWYLNGMIIVGAKGQTYTVLTSGIYQVSATLGSCTSELSLAKVFLITGNEIKVSTINIRVYPNPVESMLTIGLEGFAPDYTVKIAVTDMNGREIMNLNSMGEEEIQVNVSYFSTGLYLIRMTQHDKVRTLRFVKK
jgi:hypothetical protein